MTTENFHVRKTILKRIGSCVTICICLAFVASGQSDNNGLPYVITQLKAYSGNHIFEQAYLQFDKPYYAAGDTLYFKAYITVGELHQLSALSGILHVDLIAPGNKSLQSLMLQSSGGLSRGDFALPDSLPAGSYRVRAYTQWMLNSGGMDFFDKIIPIGSIKSEATEKAIIPVHTDSSRKADIQFFPEGGNLVAGITSKIAFKAVDTNGLGTGVKGILMDAQNRVIDSFSSTHLGMGAFSFTPLKGIAYKARVAFANGTQQVVTLPLPDSSGISLSVNNSDSLKSAIEVTASLSYYEANRNKRFFLIIYSGGKAITAPFVLDTRFTTLSVSKQQLHTGVATVTLFSGAGEPLCERLLFVQSHDQLSLQLAPDKNVYNKREKVNLQVQANNASGESVAGHFSVSVTDEEIVPEPEADETTILTHLLLTSGVSGYVEQPNYYFTAGGSKARSDLDILMLTQGYRHFQWQQVLQNNNDSLPVAYPAEKGLDIDGVAMNLSGKPLEKATITLVPSAGGPLLSSVSDNKGVFRFPNLVFMDTTRFVLSAVNSKGKNATKISFISKPYKSVFVSDVAKEDSWRATNDTAMAVYLSNEKQYIRYAMLLDSNKAHLLKEVVVKTVKPTDTYRTQSLAGAGHADQVMQADAIEQIGGLLSTSLNGRLRGINFLNGVPYLRDMGGVMSLGGGGAMMVIVDGVEANQTDTDGRPQPFSIDELPSSQIQTIEVLRFASASIYGMNGGDGVLVITTKQGEDMIKSITAVGVLPISPAGFYKAKVFYSPKYNPSNLSSKQPDLRSTIYWNPDLETDADGKTSVNYYNADNTGTYKMVIEGIDNNGNIGRQVYRYSVK